MGKENVIITASVPIELVSAAKEYARGNGVTFSELIRKALLEKIGFKGVLPIMSHGGARVGAGAKKGQGSGGDLSRFKSPETHARVCAKMRAAKAAKARGEAESLIPPFTAEQIRELNRILDAYAEDFDKRKQEAS